jgi:Tol biopolymer transport system component
VNLPDVVPIDELSGGAAVAISGNGVRVAADGGADAMRDAKWVGDGVDDADVTGLRGLEDRAVSPDGRRVAAVERQVGRATLWVVDLISGVRVRVAAARRLASPVWAPDNRTLAVGLSDGGPFALAITHVDRSDAPRILAHDTRGLLPSCWTPDAARLLAMRATSDRGWDIVAIPAAGGTLSPVVAGNADDVRAVVSPDGAHLAYLSNASGDWTLLVRRLDGDGPALAIAPDVRSVAWTGAATLLYATGDRLVRVTLSIGDGGMEAGPSRTIATGIARVARGAAPDGRVLATMRGDRSRGAHVSLGWLEALRAQLAANEPMPKSFR